jgi:transposase
MIALVMAKQRDHGMMEKRRLKAAKLFAQGKGPSEVARLLKVRRQSAHDWQRQWQQGGAPALRSKGAAGRKARLSTAQQADVAAAIIDGPQAHGYATAVWTLPRVAKLIEQRTGLGYHPGHVWRVLRGLGFSCQQLEGTSDRQPARGAWLGIEPPGHPRLASHAPAATHHPGMLASS